MNYDAQYPNIPLPRRRARFFWMTLGGLYTLYAFVLLPLLTVVGSDIAFQGTMLYELLSVLLIATELVAMCAAFAAAISARFQYGLPAALHVVLLFAVAAAFRYVATFLVSWWMEGIDPTDLVFQLIFLVVYILLDVTQVVFVLFVLHLLLRKRDQAYTVQIRALMQKGAQLPDRIREAVASHSVFSLSGPVGWATTVGALLVFLIRFVGRILFDVKSGAPVDTADLLWMIAYYTSDVIIALLCWLLIRTCVIKLLLPKERVSKR